MINAYDNLGTGVDFTNIDAPTKEAYRAYDAGVRENHTALDTQVAGDHYKNQGIQPFEVTFANFGYQGVRAAAYTKVLKYLTREKGIHRENVEKAIHCLQIQLELHDLQPNELYNDRLEPTYSSSKPIDGNK